MRDIHAEITTAIIEGLEQGLSEGKLPWNRELGGELPFNAVTGRAYRGGNCVNLWVLGSKRQYTSPNWATYKQWQTIGGQVSKGTKAVPIIVPVPIKQDDPDAEEKIRFVSANVFNQDQITGLEAVPTTDSAGGEIADIAPNPITPHERAEELISASGAVINIGGIRAFYAPDKDAITMPDRARFVGTDTMSASEGWYSTALHELTHWTGHETRLNRCGIVKPKRSKDEYAFEELIAELGAAFLCARTGITPMLRDDHIQYISTWIKNLQEDSRAIFKAASSADKAADFLWAKMPSETATKPEVEAAA